MFNAEIVEDLYSKNLCSSSFPDSLNEFVKSKLPAIREQAIRDFIGGIANKYPLWPSNWLLSELEEMTQKLHGHQCQVIEF